MSTSNSPVPNHPPPPVAVAASDQDWALRLEQEKRMTQQLSAKNEALSSQQQFVVERAADFALQQQQRIAALEAQLGAAAPPLGTDHHNHQNPNNNNSSSSILNTSADLNLGGTPINVRHGCPRCATCSTLLQTVGQLETMLQNRDADCDTLRRALDDAQRVNALLLEQIDLLQRGLEKALLNRTIPQTFHGHAPQLPLHHSVSPPRQNNNNNINNNSNNNTIEAEAAAVATTSSDPQQPIASFTNSNLPASVRMLHPSSEPTLRAMADAVASLQNLWLDMSGSPGSSRYKQPPAVPPKKLEV